MAQQHVDPDEAVRIHHDFFVLAVGETRKLPRRGDAQCQVARNPHGRARSNPVT